MTSLPESLLTIEEVAEMLALSRPTIWRHVKFGLLPKPIKIGAASRWKLSSIQAVIAEAEAKVAAT